MSQAHGSQCLFMEFFDLKTKTRSPPRLCPTGFLSFIFTKVKMQCLGPLGRPTPRSWARITTAVAQADPVLEDSVVVTCKSLALGYIAQG